MSNLNLMVGDWVDYTDASLITHRVKVEVSDLVLIDYAIKNNETTVVYNPILLTPEILKKIEGMEKIHAMQYRFGKRLFIIRDGIVFDYASDLSLPHVNTLQQLIRLFTGKEIEIKW